MNLVPTLSLLLIAAYFVFLFASLKRRGRVISGPWLFLLRSFFPNWRFYHGFGAQPRLFFRTLDAAAGHAEAEPAAPDGGWTMFIPRAGFHPAQLFHNARNNLLLANQNLVDHLSFDVQTLADGQDVRELVTYQMVDRLARELLAHQGLPCTHYQFQLRLVPPMTAPNEEMAILTSPLLAWASPQVAVASNSPSAYLPSPLSAAAPVSPSSTMTTSDDTTDSKSAG